MAKLSDLKAKGIKPGDRNIPDGTVTGLRLEAGKTKGRGKWTRLGAFIVLVQIPHFPYLNERLKKETLCHKY
tara:strand:- start:444 stop:659 length:216 start_codon:yes stop_codon:yes gene_type:complete